MKLAFFVMNPIESINKKKDTSLAFMYEAAHRGYHVMVTTPDQLIAVKNHNRGTQIQAVAQRVVFHGAITSFEVLPREIQSLHEATFVFMRQDPPVDVRYITVTYLLDFVEQSGVRVVNQPTSVRSSSEKIVTLQFPSLGPDTLVASKKNDLKEFIRDLQDVVIKPLDGMGGTGVFRLKVGDQNIDSILEMLTENETRLIMAQRYIPDIVDGDKRILMINGTPIGYALARVPQQGALRGNLAAGGKGYGVALSDRDRFICNSVGPWLREQQLYFVGLDVIGDFLTEMNVTSPTCVRELDHIYNLNISAKLFDELESL